ncbi:hypothetical protein INR49_024415 [Caranx melampygus]|nr:hypothetical protein INR49_024415 [Caranx melampygus]
MFVLDKDTGEIRVKGEIDFEKLDVYKLDVHATDKGQPPMSTDCRVVIKVLDENDNKPEIEITSLSNMVPEDSKPGTVVSLISVTDKDAGLNDNVPFELKPSFQENMYSLVLKSHLDRESVSHYDIEITATDCGQPPLSTFKTLSIDVSDVNDNNPEFLQNPIELYLRENNVNQDNGALCVHKKIDREELCQGSGACHMELKILVENPLEIHYVVVEITDVNDHSPTFPEKQQTFETGEQTLPGKRFQLHTARDPDAGTNSIRTYTLTSNDHFEIDTRQSDDDKIPFLVLKKPLDREQKNKHTLLVTAVDGGKPPRSGTLNVSIIVLDSNDNRPVFSQEIYQIEIPENVPVGTSVFQINATDPDESTNGEIEYSLGKTLKKKVYDIFELDKLTGEIRVKGVVDYEENDVYKLDIEASDKGTPPLAVL